MADIIDEHGNPIQLTDELGRPVQLTDEHGVPIHLTGIATTKDSETVGSEHKMHGGTHISPPCTEGMGGAGVETAGVGGGPPLSHPVSTGVESQKQPLGAGPPLSHPVTGGVETQKQPLGAGAPVSHPVTGGAETQKQHLGRTESSSSSSSEDDGQGGRRKKKGFMQKIKEKLPGHKHKEEQSPEKVYTATTKVSVTTPAGPVGEPKPELIHVEHHEEEHEKKGFMDKIKDKLPGHHSH